MDRTKQIESCLNFLKKEVANIENHELRDICEMVINDPRFQKSSGSNSKKENDKRHHDYIGGLVTHTSEVLDGVLYMTEAEWITDIDVDALITATIFHDYAKIYDYNYDNGEITNSDHHDKIRHLTRSYAEFMIMAAKFTHLTEEQKNKIGHIMLAHHGRQEWGSPVLPQTPEAHILHLADMLSCKARKDYYVRE